jgi:hypothetical protein
MQNLIQQISLSGRHDVIIEADMAGEHVVAGVLYATAKSRIAGNFPKASVPHYLLIVPETELPVAQAFLSGLETGKHRKNNPVLIGAEENARTDLNILREQAAAVITTPRRLIDHLRRKNISLERVKRIGLFQPEDEQDVDSYGSDIQFIFTKLSKKCHTLLFSMAEQRSPVLEKLLTRPKLITADVDESQRELTYSVFNEVTEQAVSDYIYANELDQVQLVCTNEDIYNRLSAFFNQDHLNLDVSVNRFPNGDLRQVPCDHVIIVGVPENSRIPDIIAASGSKTLHIIISSAEEQFVSHNQEMFRMKKKSLPEDREVLKGKIASLISEVEKDSNPEQLNELRKLIKKASPFYRRGYLTAYLLRAYFDGETGSSPARKPRKQVDSDASATLFFGIGKNRKTFPKDIARLLKEQAGFDNEEIHSIKTLDNYSFVAVTKEKAPTAIEKLDGMKYKGRPLVVNFAKSKAK